MKQFYIIILSLILFSCKGEANKQETVTPNKVEKQIEETVTPKVDFVINSIDDPLAMNIANALVNNHLKNDMNGLTVNDRQFQFYKIDLNNDGNQEIFVRLMSSYFCGSGGCTFLLLDHLGERITKFTVTRAPLFIENNMQNGWRVLLVKDAGVFKELIYTNGSYPTNPSIIPKAPYDAPSGHAEILFDDNFSKSKTYTF